MSVTLFVLSHLYFVKWLVLKRELQIGRMIVNLKTLLCGTEQWAWIYADYPWAVIISLGDHKHY